MNNNIEDKLINYSKKINNSNLMITDEERRNIIDALLERNIPVRKSSKITTFIFEQIGFVIRYALIWYIAWIALFYYLILDKKYLLLDMKTFSIISMMPPLLLLLTVEEIAKIYLKSMLEIEYATKYSLEKVMMVRLTILTLTNIVVVIGVSFFVSFNANMSMYRLLIYGLTPMLLYETILLKCMESIKGSQLKYIAFSIYGIALAVCIFMNISEKQIFEPSSFVYWEIVFVMAVILCILQFARTRKMLINYEKISNA